MPNVYDKSELWKFRTISNTHFKVLAMHKKLKVRHLEIVCSVIQSEAQYYMLMSGNYLFYLSGLSLSSQFSCVVFQCERTVL